MLWERIKDARNSHWARAAAYLLLTVVLLLAVSLAQQHAVDTAASALVKSQRAGCVRGNAFRKAVNSPIENAVIQQRVLYDFLSNAAVARRANFDSTHLETDRIASQQYRRLADRVREQVRFIPIQLTDCDAAYPNP